jgi:hypothetical protein
MTEEQKAVFRAKMADAKARKKGSASTTTSATEKTKVPAAAKAAKPKKSGGEGSAPTGDGGWFL